MRYHSPVNATLMPGNTLLRQSGMQLARMPGLPSPHVFIQVASPMIPAAWRAYLSV